MTYRRSIITLLLAGFWLTSCGGGGGSGGDPSTTNPTPDTNLAQTTVTEQLAGVVMDGYLQNAFVFADLNENYAYDGNEPSVFTDADGRYKLNVALDHRNATIVARAISGTTIDLDYPSTPIQADYQMLSAKGANHIVSPISTWVHAVQREENASLGTAEAIVAEQLGLNQLGQSSVLIDYVAEPTEHAKALHNHAKISASALAEHHNASSLIDTVSNAANAYTKLLQDSTVKQTLNQGQVVAKDALISIVEKVAPTHAASIKAQITQQAPSTVDSTSSGNTDSGNSDSGSTDSGSTDSGNSDSGSTDSGSTDSGSTDSGSTDS
ncbi:MAG: hypothetical protein HWE20_08715, partial [Gammaproteobacteria bacterium]|nr:hypothetical protein [Gammaproteobacteria bacterium]